MNEKTVLKIVLGFLVVMLIGAASFLVVGLNSYVETSATGVATVGIVSEERVVAVSSTVPAVTEVKVQEEEEQEDEEEDVAITGTALERASTAALKHIGEGRVTDTEVGDEEGYYEIEIRLNNGGEVDVHLDEDFNVLSTEYEDEDDDD